jgi:hypothetical protein
MAIALGGSAGLEMLSGFRPPIRQDKKFIKPPDNSAERSKGMRMWEVNGKLVNAGSLKAAQKLFKKFERQGKLEELPNVDLSVEVA